MPNKSLEEIKEVVMGQLTTYFDSKISCFDFQDVYSVPYNTMKINFTLYNYCSARILLESESIYFYILSADRVLEIFESPIPLDEISKALPLFDEQVQLRIPNKFLAAKAWAPLK